MQRKRLLILIGLVAAVIGGCGDNDPTSIERPPQVNGFEPEEQVLSAFVGDTLRFSVSASDPDHSLITQSFMLGDSLVTTGDHWTYVVRDTGEVKVRALVTDGSFTSRVEWNLRRVIPTNHPPVIVEFHPVESAPRLIIDNALEFALLATDEDDDSLSYFFTVDGELVSRKPHFLYTALEIEDRVVTGVVGDGEFFQSKTWNLKVTDVPDDDPPAQIPVTSIETGAEPGEISLAWVAVGEDGFDGVASVYHVRTSPSPIVDEVEWDRASIRPRVPAPAASGQTMSMIVDGLTPARFSYVAVRAEDDFGNLSPLHAAVGAYTRGMRVTGNVFDAVSGEPLSGVSVRLAHFATTSAIDGGFEFIELPPVDGDLIARDDPDDGEVGAYYDFRETYEIIHNDYLPLYLLPNKTLTTTEYGGFRQFLLALIEQDGIPLRHNQRRWALPINVYVPPFQANGLDYRQVVVEVLEELEPYLGFDLFEVVDQPPDLGVNVEFSGSISVDHYVTTERTSDYYPVKGRVRFRTVYAPNTITPFKKIIRHEFGHAMGLKHSVDVKHLMVGGVFPSATTFTDDEVSVIRALFNIPRGQDMGAYVYN